MRDSLSLIRALSHFLKGGLQRVKGLFHTLAATIYNS
jgi:hypothetical protein